MKKSTLFELAIKITGLVALWHAVMASPTLFAGFTIFASALSNFGTQGGFMAILGISMFLNIAVAGFFAYLCLMKTGMLLRLFKFDNEEELDLKTEKKVFFEIAVFLAAIMLLISGLTNLVSYDYKTDYKTETINQMTNNQISTNTYSYFQTGQLLLPGCSKDTDTMIWIRHPLIKTDPKNFLAELRFGIELRQIDT
ncbi:hypothetical protein [Pedobacter psychroterrae]|uniref:Uncharacterized protein n=1 Tax=Pedobacter psychroterrae TaxID=2530453 RepID=A0A4R0NEU7_9SPHI|nr:hypothetical protein [Pedobacter psychroterrae]TCC98971.1 hypothetical protein EZ437_17705 [Pedobacter psychroterrae]